MGKKFLIFSLLVALLVAPATEAARRPTTSLGGDISDSTDNMMIGCTPEMGESVSATVDGETFAFGIPKSVMVNELGYMLSTRSKEVSVAKPIDPNSAFARKVMAYLSSSKEMQDALKVRMTARQIRYSILSKALKADKKSDPKLVDALLKFYAMSVKSPLVILDKAPIPEFIRAPGAGPCMMPYGVVVMDEKGEPATLESSVLCVTDLGKEGQAPTFSVNAAVDNDTLDIVLAHENAHAVQYDMYGPAYFKIKRISNIGHDTPIITDQAMAIIEGWAEAFEAVYGPATVQFAEKDRKKYNISEFLYTRQDPVRRDRYIWLTTKGKKTGAMKNPLQLMSTEGVIAGQFYDILTSKKIAAPLEKCLTVFLLCHPENYPQFVRGFLNFFPDDRNVLTRIVLEGTNYATMTQAAEKAYYAYYQGKLGYVQKKTSKEEFEKGRQSYVSLKEDLFKKAIAGEDLFANVAPDLWFSGVWLSDKPADREEFTKIELARKEIRKQLGIPEGKHDPNRWDFNLNTVSSRILVFIGLSADDAKKIVAERGKRAGFQGDPLKIIEEIIGSANYAEWVKKMQIKPLADDEKKTTPAVKQVNILYPEDMEKLCVGPEI